MWISDRFRSWSQRFESLPPWLRVGLTTATLLAVFWLDYVTPAYISLSGFYLLPLFLAAWYCGPVVTVGATVVAVAGSGYIFLGSVGADTPPWQQTLAFISVGAVAIGFVLLMLTLRRILTRLRNESRRDALTGLPNRRGFFEAMEAEMARAARNGHLYCLGLVDLDNFKHVNDTHGHQRGDELLAAIARCMEASLREIDLVGRIGGDEFAVLLPETNLEQARTVLRRLHDALRTVIGRFDERAGASIGAGIANPILHHSLTETMARVDDLMYTVKRDTKNDVVVLSL